MGVSRPATTPRRHIRTTKRRPAPLTMTKHQITGAEVCRQRTLRFRFAPWMWCHLLDLLRSCDFVQNGQGLRDQEKMATSNDVMPKGDEESNIGNPVPQEQPPPYQPQPQNYGTGGEPVPPAYEAGPPPSYDSVFGQVKAAKQQSSSTTEFFKKFIVILLGTLGCTICIGLVLAIPVSMIAMGSCYLHDCPREPYIPIYLIVAGVFGVLKNLSNITQRVKNKQSDQDEDNIKTNPFDGALSCFLLGWFIAGNVWIYRVYNDYNPDDVTSPDYCNPIMYVYAFWITTSVYIMAALSCCCFGFAGLVAGLAGSGEK
ncbi:hypothetical protein LSH36_3g07017 [Paralvinella palmiformis]|uniref:Transmembrane protein 272-like n=1 Tax=Paralvinella palmiformis TaxID=53620 RepID=A0AAD9KET1_9ANNE|nr:hypothetical protein LSH36_3g07017 [Paralvinella palmiformis]